MCLVVSQSRYFILFHRNYEMLSKNVLAMLRMFVYRQHIFSLILAQNHFILFTCDSLKMTNKPVKGFQFFFNNNTHTKKERNIHTTKKNKMMTPNISYYSVYLERKTIETFETDLLLLLVLLLLLLLLLLLCAFFLSVCHNYFS